MLEPIKHVQTHPASETIHITAIRHLEAFFGLSHAFLLIIEQTLDMAIGVAT
jgi:hypothetical protein